MDWRSLSIYGPIETADFDEILAHDQSGEPVSGSEIKQVKEIMMIWQGILVLVLMGLARAAMAADPGRSAA